MDPVTQFVSQYGVVAVLGWIVIKDLGGYLVKRYTSSSPSVLPANPTAPSPHPVLDAVLGKVFGKNAPSGQTVAPSFLQTLAADIGTALTNQGVAPTAPAPAVLPTAAPK